MIELVVVMVLMGVLAAVAMPRFTDRNALAERAFFDRLKSVLRQARQLAVAQQRDVCVWVAAPQLRLTYVNAGACSPVLTVADPVGAAPLTVPVPTGAVLGGATLVRFNGAGHPVPDASQTVSVGALSLTISRETGAVL